MIISIQYLYWLAGVLLLITAGMILMDRTHPKRWTSALFWLLFAIPFLIGERLPSVAIGVGIVVMALIAGMGGVGRGKHAELHDKASRASAGRLGHTADHGDRIGVAQAHRDRRSAVAGPEKHDLRFSRYRLPDRPWLGVLVDP